MSDAFSKLSFGSGQRAVLESGTRKRLLRGPDLKFVNNKIFRNLVPTVIIPLVILMGEWEKD